MNILHTLGKATGYISKAVVTSTLKGTGTFMSGFKSSMAAKQSTPTNYVPAPQPATTYKEEPVQAELY